MKFRFLLVLTGLLVAMRVQAQVGTASQPFISLAQARTVSTAGIYHFTIAGQGFSSYVDANGYVQIAVEFGADAPAALPQSNALTATVRGILTPQILGVLTEMAEVRISSSDLTKLDAKTENAGVFNKVLTNDAIKADYLDDGINGDWTGTGSEYLNAPGGAPNTNGDRPLHEEIFHNYYSDGGLHWIPYRGDQALIYANNVTAAESYTLWVRAAEAPPGSTTNPFTSLYEAATVTTAGIYHFYLGGQRFTTYVDASGYVQIATEYGADEPPSALPQSTNLTSTARGILTPAALAVLTEMTEVRMSSSDLSKLNATTENVGVFNKILANDAIKGDYRDDAINADWTGTGSGHLTGTGGEPNTNGDRPLHEEVFHNYYNAGGVHWIPYRGDQALTHTNNVAATESYTLWVRAVGAVLPLRLGQFTGATEGKFVRLRWEILSAGGGDFVQLERSLDGRYFQPVYQYALADNPQPGPQEFLDPLRGRDVVYYRLRQTDLDGSEDLSSVLAVRMPRPNRPLVRVYPNPTAGRTVIEGVSGPIRILDALGSPLPGKRAAKAAGEGRWEVDLSDRPAGIYYIAADGEVYRIVRL